MMMTSSPSLLNEETHTNSSLVPRLLQSANSFFSCLGINNSRSINSSKNPTAICAQASSSSLLSSSGIGAPAVLADNPVLSISTPFFSSHQIIRSYNSSSASPSSSSPLPMKSMSSPGFPSSVRIDGLNSSSKVGGPAFVGQVFSMCDPSGTGLMAVTTHLDIPFISKRTPEWIKRILAMVTKSEKNGPVFRFFMDLSDAVAYVKRLNIPTGMVGACRLDVAYEHFKEKPHMFRFVPSEKQVKEAKKLLKTNPQYSRRRLEGVPVFTAQNLNIAIATTDGIKWYAPYFFDKSLLDNILEASTDQHFHTLIQNRHMQRRRDVIDDSLATEVIEESGESLFEPPEVQEVLDEMGNPGIPLSVLSKAAEIQLLDVVDKVLLGNRWLRKATGIQPKFPYLVDSFEERSAASFMKAMESTSSAVNSEDTADNGGHGLQLGASEFKSNGRAYGDRSHPTNSTDFRFPFGDWFLNPWSKPDNQIKTDRSNTRMASWNGECINQAPPNPLLPKITMVGISTGEAGQMSRASLKKTMEDLTKELEQTTQRTTQPNEEKDPLFVANVGDYSSITRMSSA
ncbi:uncharacterized protein LOC131245022 isoform X2 [Magnolia sinica]|uniref:uncharacterized protein LOC131245022 isoform X2 n=1 Tax=Magnolia sinica TaxID=86752 RepID=UPI00265B2930|nr:uncharacterized protein LOC131245022 isoform X2 [Magnolia sinica]